LEGSCEKAPAVAVPFADEGPTPAQPKPTLEAEGLRRIPIAVEESRAECRKTEQRNKTPELRRMSVQRIEMKALQ
jgi:hypothetical protein